MPGTIVLEAVTTRKAGDELELVTPDRRQKPKLWRLAIDGATSAERMDSDSNIILVQAGSHMPLSQSIFPVHFFYLHCVLGNVNAGALNHSATKVKLCEIVLLPLDILIAEFEMGNRNFCAWE